MRTSNLVLLAWSAILAIAGMGCDSSAHDNDPGMEYMPDMFHSLAYEANYFDYYYYNTWGSEEAYYKLAQPRKPIPGTIARGFTTSSASMTESSHDSLQHEEASMDFVVPEYHTAHLHIGGGVPYPYANTDSARTMATAEIIKNPYPITTAGLQQAKPLYDVYCGICHGEKGDGLGYLYDDSQNKNVKYLAAPANFLTDEFMAASNGRYYHAIMYGKGVMGSYKDKLNYEERWQVIHYIRMLQAKKAGKEYSGTLNTFTEHSIPGDDDVLEAHTQTARFAWENEHADDAHGMDRHQDAPTHDPEVMNSEEAQEHMQEHSDDHQGGHH